MATTFGACFIFLETNKELNQNKRYTIIDGLWWAVITMTTVGYGDVCPKTNSGKLLGAVCSFVGTLGIAFPIPVVVAHFNFLYNLDRDDCKLSPEELDGTSPQHDASLFIEKVRTISLVSNENPVTSGSGGK